MPEGPSLCNYSPFFLLEMDWKGEPKNLLFEIGIPEISQCKRVLSPSLTTTTNNSNNMFTFLRRDVGSIGEQRGFEFGFGFLLKRN
ncbi:unnamed protein product [Lactuca virosa]|uniref:Uncharacterized protein n=1 Tax=Lactuca virosa TaxID=75947 RepID=A0AAU9LL40_9ASTR|nr:unnamed protein product [Lactuca virosa]